MAHADTLDPFAGKWGAHEEGLEVQADGHGRETFNGRSTCPNAPMAGCGKTGSTDFVLTSLANGVASGTITASTNPKSPVGGPVSLALTGGGQGLDLTIAGGDQRFPFCKAGGTDRTLCGAKDDPADKHRGVAAAASLTPSRQRPPSFAAATPCQPFASDGERNE
jgi:hypothetical protein